MDNKIILFDENQNEEIVYHIEGLNITFKGKNNVVKIEKGSIFQSSHIILSNHCKINIKRTKSMGIRNLSAELSDYNEVKIGKNFGCVSLRLSLHAEENLKVTIGNDCLFGASTFIRPTDGHAIYDINTKELLNKGEDVVIGNHVWMGLNCVVLKGARVLDNTIIGANSVVTKKFDEENVVIVGNPAKIVKRGVNWAVENPTKYNKLSSVKSSVGSSSVADNLIHRKRKFDKIRSFAYVFKKENLNPKNIYRIYKAKGRIKSLNLFDEDYYLNEYLNVRNSDINPLDHYIYHGWMENKVPSRKFDGNYYLKRYLM